MVVSQIVKPQRIKYTEELKITVEGLIDKMLKDIISSDEKLSNMVSVCMKDSIEWQALRLITKALFQKNKYITDILSRVKLTKENRVTRWSLYNAVTEFCTRSERLKPHVDAWLQNKAERILATPFAKLTEEVMKGKDGGSE